MVLDTSALLAILQDEPERRAFTEAIEAADSRALSAANYVEASIAIEVRLGADGVRDLDLLVERAALELVSVDAEQARTARLAFGRYGKGRHRAGLNFGDCFAYALAKTRFEALLCKADDFVHTDLTTLAVAPARDGDTEHNAG